jgi:hypothetical protein
MDKLSNLVLCYLHYVFCVSVVVTLCYLHYVFCVSVVVTLCYLHYMFCVSVAGSVSRSQL